MFFAKRDDLPTNITSYDLIKFIAVIIMLTDHVGAFFFPDNLWLRVIGRSGLPVWFFLAGYSRAKEVDKTLWAGAGLLILGNIAFGQYVFPANALVSVIVIRLILENFCTRAFKNIEVLVYAFFAIIMLCVPTNFLFEYGTLAILLAMVGYVVRNKRNLPISETTRVVFIGMSIVSIAVIQALSFNFNTIQSVFCIAGIVAMGILLFFFRPMEFPKITNALPSFVNAMIKFGGRYTLEIYVFHLLIIKAYLLYANYGFYHWFAPTVFPVSPTH